MNWKHTWKLYDIGPVLSSGQIDEFEARWNVKIPEQYRDMLLTVANGASFSPRGSFYVVDLNDGNDLHGISGIGHKTRYLQLEDNMDLPDMEGLYSEWLPIGSDSVGGLIIINQKNGQIFYRPHDTDDYEGENLVCHIADSLEEFFDGLMSDEELSEKISSVNGGRAIR